MSETARDEGMQDAVPVVIYLPFQILKGSLYRPAPIRLSDRINLVEDNFLTLSKPRIIDLGRQQLEPVPAEGPWFVYRGEILMIHEVPSAGAPPQVAGSPEERVPKRPIQINAYVGPFSVQGNLYVSEYSDLEAFLNRTSLEFLPMTSATITLPARTDLGVISVPFVLVNRSRLAIGPAGGRSSAG